MRNWQIPQFNIVGILIAAVVGLAVKAGGSFALDAPDASLTIDPSIVVQIVLYCLLTGLVEETIFCGILLRALCRRLNPLAAAAICAVIFGCAHILTGASLNLGVGGVILKSLQAALFGFCIYSLYLATEKLLWPVALHAVFDFIYLGIPMIYMNVAPLAFDNPGVQIDTLTSLIAVLAVLLPITIYNMLALKTKENDPNETGKHT